MRDSEQLNTVPLVATGDAGFETGAGTPTNTSVQATKENHVKKTITTSAITIAAALVFGACAPADKNGDGYLTPNEADGNTYQDNTGNRSSLGSYTRSDAARTYSAMSYSEKKAFCDTFWSMEDLDLINQMVSVGYPRTDAQVVIDYAWEVC